ncbi:MAG: helix-turn-helix domain-containing protein [Phycisphaerales bacterium]
MSTPQTSFSEALDDSVLNGTDVESGRSESTGGSSFHARLNAAAGQISYRKLGGLTDTHPETVRRYMQGQAPSATFLTNLCRVLGISGEWLLTGRGPMKVSQIKSHALGQADPSELMTAVANTLTDLCDRMDRLERYVQTLETRVRGHLIRDERILRNEGNSSVSDSMNSAKSNTIGVEDQHEPAGQAYETKPNAPIDPNASSGSVSSAQRIRDALAKRPSRVVD